MFLSETLFYIRNNIFKYIIYLSVVFFIAMISGVFYALYFTVDATTLFDLLATEFEGIASVGPVTTMLVIFFNNTIKTFIVMILGLFFGLFPLLFVFINGFVVGIFGYFFYTTSQLSIFVIGILPHGIFEIPAFILSSAIGVHLGAVGFQRLFRNRKKLLKKNIVKGMNVYTHAIIPLFFIAAFIETFISSYLIASNL